MAKQAFLPIADQNSKILILGTMPGEKSLQLQQYYGHRGNHFWKIIFHLFSIPLSSDYEVRKKLLLTKGIALWDVLEACEREGSSDTNIQNEVPNDFNVFHKKHPQIKTIFFGSGKAEEYYDTYIGKNQGMSYYKLPSPSSANTWKTFEEKTDEWKIILKHL